MKTQIVKAINVLLQPLDVQFVRRTKNSENSELSMPSMVQRLAQRHVPIQSVLDIGASDGKWSIGCMKHFPNARYLAIEPLEERKPALEENKCGFANFDYALCVAGGVDGEEVTFNVTEDLDGSTVQGQNPGVSRTCRVRTVDSLVAEKNLSGPYLLKFDTHGYEIPILSGSTEVLKNSTAIIMETYNFQITPTSLRFHEMCAHLENLGFRSADIAGPMLRSYDKAFWQIDFLFLRTDSEVFKYPHYR